MTHPTADKDGAAVKSQVHVVSLPEFGYSQLDVSTSSVVNPADLPDAALACGAMEYYDRPSDTYAGPRRATVALTAQWWHDT